MFVLNMTSSYVVEIPIIALAYDRINRSSGDSDIWILAKHELPGRPSRSHRQRVGARRRLDIAQLHHLCKPRGFSNP